MDNLNQAMTNLKSAHFELYKARRKLRSIELGIRKHGYPKLIQASNTQKMQLEFEHLAASDEEDFQTWKQLVNDVEEKEGMLFEAQIDYDVAFMREQNERMGSIRAMDGDT